MNIDDPKLTAYALGELTGEERQTIEQELVSDPQLRAFVQETAAFARLLNEEFHAEMSPAELAPAQRSEVVEKANGGEKIVRPSWWTWMRFAELAAALAVIGFLASLSVPAVTSSLVRGKQIRDRALALNTPPASQPETLVLGEARYKHAEATQSALASTDAAVEKKQASDTTVVHAAPVLTAQPLAVDNMSSLAANTPAEPFAPRDAALSSPSSTTSGEASIAFNGATAGLDKSQSVSNESIAVSAGKLSVAQNTSSAAPGKSGFLSRRERDAVDGALGYDDKVTQLAGTRQLWRVSKGWERPVPVKRYVSSADTESYTSFNENLLQEVAQQPLSTFSIDVDTASYSNVRRLLKSGQRPPPAAVRIEELINYFHYDYPQPKGDAPFSVNVETALCPWEPEHRLVRIGLKGREIAEAARPASNLVFLMDISGSMADENKLPLLKQCMRALVEKLTENDKVSIVVYAGSTGVALPPTRGDQKERIFQALDGLNASGSTNGGDGIRLAYKTASENLIPKGTNRVILATDGDFNVGTTSESELVKLIEEKRKSGVFLTVLGVGEGNLKDSMMKKLSSHGNGNYAYIDSLREGRKVLVKQLSGTLITIAKDVKIQVEFNPQKVSSYRLIGYESRMLAKEDFNNDKKDAGEIGAGHTVTALYEVVPVGMKVPGSVDALKYQPEKSASPAPAIEGPVSKEMLTVKLRYKKPTEETSLLIEQPVNDSDTAIEQSSPDFRFAAAVAEFGMLLRGSNQSGSANWDHVYKLAADAEGRDEGGSRAEFLELVEKARGVE